MSTILSSSSRLTPLSAKRRWCWAKTGPLQQADNKQVGVLSIAWMTKEPYSAYHKDLPKCSMLSSASPHPKETPEEEKWQRKEDGISRSLGELWYLAAPTTWLSPSAEGNTGTSTNTPQRTPALQCFWATISLCAACMSACFDGFAEEALSDHVLRSFLLSNAGLR